MINTDTAPTFGELCTEFDQANAKNPVYLRACEFLVRTVSGTMEGNMNFLIAQRVTAIRDFKFKRDSDVYRWLLERHGEDEVSAFEKELKYFIE